LAEYRAKEISKGCLPPAVSDKSQATKVNSSTLKERIASY